MPIQTTTLVSLLAWTYRDQRADLMSGDDLDRPPGTTTRIDLPSELRLSGKGMTWDRVAENAASGCVIKTTAGRQRPALHPDAEVVHNIVRAVPGGGRSPVAGGEPSTLAGERDRGRAGTMDRRGRVIPFGPSASATRFCAKPSS